MAQTQPWRPTLTPAQEDELFMLMLEDDTEEAPWMTMGDLQFWSASSFAHSLRTYAHERKLGWYVASMLPIIYGEPSSTRKRQLSPNTFVAFVPEHSRQSFDVAREGGFPPFILEVVSPSSIERDEIEKRHAYELLGVREYALFAPRDGDDSTLAGFRRGDDGQFAPWVPDAEGRLWSETLGLFLAVRGPFLQAETAEGELLLTPEQTGAAWRGAKDALERETAARQREVAARERETMAREREVAAREAAEAEVARLCEELARLRGERGE